MKPHERHALPRLAGDSAPTQISSLVEAQIASITPTRMFSPCRSPRPTMCPTMHHTAVVRVYASRALSQAAGSPHLPRNLGEEEQWKRRVRKSSPHLPRNLVRGDSRREEAAVKRRVRKWEEREDRKVVASRPRGEPGPPACPIRPGTWSEGTAEEAWACEKKGRKGRTERLL